MTNSQNQMERAITRATHIINSFDRHTDNEVTLGLIVDLTEQVHQANIAFDRVKNTIIEARDLAEQTVAKIDTICDKIEQQRAVSIND